MSMYIRVKRHKRTIFLQVEPTDTVLEVKHKLQDLCEQPPENQQLFKDEVKLDDARRLAEVHVENDDVLALTLMKEDGTFEEIDITSPEAEEEGSAQ
uniref:Ubiquitin-like protein n=1 Tax=Tetraselmis sp. GSL018 TaxID=582737 RepID=A0A061RKD2_9CHLO|mmetsp:Transcript_13735/g.32544  ORF Transcript_13735/g.32544 Transcript_13735/m.32544 type:complete len:97 (+) Transcript_13735:93-383(+)|eukprot:CAMPEP_0177582814 /NCGR_PEP_ID=MMETSP0419_2-20121207/2972_1 /TAXON_ID=582737 /ORGANISM="Tetraselmis sp., Strain GSL018" /LENGTH=96 /DNA_ID=CAMNT_0019072129 /DNA_START=144 /DNA_END=434 /DNA_ORIENTATION=+